MIISKRFLNILIFISLFLIFPILSSAQKWGKISEEEWNIVAPEDYPEANAVIIFDKGTLNVKKRIISFENHVRIKILTEAGIEEEADRTIRFYKKYDKVKGFEAHTITPDGKKHKVEKNAIFEKKVDDFMQKTFTFPQLEVGCIIEYKYRIRSKRFYYLSPWYFQSSTYTLKSQIEVSLVSGFEYNIAFQNVPARSRSPKIRDAIDPDRQIGIGKIKIYTYTKENLPPIKDEPYMGAEDDYRSSVRFKLVSYQDQYGVTNFGTNWSDIGEDFQKYLNKYCNKQSKVKKLAKEITEGLTTKTEKSQAIFQYVASEFETSTEYESRWFSQNKMSKVFETKFASAEGKNVLLTELHKVLDIDAWSVLISTRAHGLLDPSYADLRQFNYLISFVQFEDKWEFLDASSDLSIYGVLPPKCISNGGLLVDGGKSSLVKMTISPISSQRIDVTKMYVSPDGSVVCSTECGFGGYYASLYIQRRQRNQDDEFIEDYFTDRIDAEHTLNDYSIDLDSLNRFYVNLNYSSSDMIRKLDNNMMIKYAPLAFGSNPFKSEKRFFNVDFMYPFSYHNVVEIYYQGEKDQQLPENLSFKIAGASFQRLSVATDSVITVDSKLVIEKAVFKPRNYSKLRDFFVKIANASQDEVAIIQK